MTDFFDFWKVYLVTDSLLSVEIQSVLNQNPHVSYEGDNTFTFDLLSTPCIDGVTMAGSQRAFFHFEFEPLIPVSAIPLEKFEVGIAQYDSGVNEPVGSCVFVIDNSNGTLNGAPTSVPFNIAGYENNQTFQEVSKTDWSTQPNPAVTGVDIKFNLKTRRCVEIEIYDVLGRKITSNERIWYTNEPHKVHFDVSDWPNGIYYVYFKYDMNSDVKRLLINKEN